MKIKQSYITLILAILLIVISFFYFSLREQYLIQNQLLQNALEKQSLYMSKYVSCLNTQAQMVNWRLEKYQKAIDYYQRVYRTTVYKYKNLPVAVGGGR